MFESMNGTGTSRLPKQFGAPSSTASTLGKTVGGALLQAAAIVVVAKLVDVAIESFLNRRRARQQQTPQRNHEPIGV